MPAVVVGQIGGIHEGFLGAGRDRRAGAHDRDRHARRAVASARTGVPRREPPQPSPRGVAVDRDRCAAGATRRPRASAGTTRAAAPGRPAGPAERSRCARRPSRARAAADSHRDAAAHEAADAGGCDAAATHPGGRACAHSDAHTGSDPHPDTRTDACTRSDANCADGHTDGVDRAPGADYRDGDADPGDHAARRPSGRRDRQETLPGGERPRSGPRPRHAAG